jgi:5-oxoprolinase (ATP-hydrolysing)
VTTPTSIVCSLPPSIPLVSSVPLPPPRTVRDVHFGGKTAQPTPLYLLADLQSGALLNGPALVIDELTTLVVEPHCRAYVCEGGHVTVAIDSLLPSPSSSSSSPSSSEPVDPVLLSIFSHRFMSIAEQMGRTLQRTAISTNIKERLDFSCALFDADGGLVANAPHIPVHLGSMQDAVRFQVNKWGASLKPGKSPFHFNQ